MQDPRHAWLLRQITKAFKEVSEESVLELVGRDGAGLALQQFFEVDKVSLIVSATAGDTFDTDGDQIVEDSDEDDDDGDRPPRFEKIRHQRLNIHLNFIGSNLTNTRCLFIVKTVPKISVEDANGWEEAESTFDSLFEVTCTDVPSLLSFHVLLMHVFLPLVEDAPVRMSSHIAADTAAIDDMDGGLGGLDGTEKAPGVGADAAAQGGEGTPQRGATTQLHTEVISWVKRLNQHVAGFIGQVCAERKLPMPANPLPIGDSEADIKAAASNDDIIKDIDATVSTWHNEISSVLAQEPQKEGPLGEIEYWKEKYSALSALYEQINMQQVKIILRVAQEAECNAWHSISGTLTLLMRQYAEAKDNVKFLNTLDRHFRIIHSVTPETGTLQPIIDTMSSMMMAIRMVWIISRYYCTEEKMLGLLEKIAMLIAQKVSQHIDHRTILSQRPAEAKRKIKEGQQCLLKWKSAYTHVQEEINQSGESHWVFDPKRLFDNTDYMADRCAELLEIVGVVEYYNTVLGSQLKAVLTDTLNIEKILKDVEKLKKPIETMSFDPFDKKAMHNWSMMYSNFNSSVATLDQQVTQFIQKIFDDELRSAESAFDLLQSFKNMHSRMGDNILDIKKLLATKADKILLQYLHEVQRVEQIFLTHCNQPPLTKNQPPIAGSIHWSSSLYLRLKKPIMRFHDEQMLNSTTGKEVKRKYADVARMMKDYATVRFEKWKEEVRSCTTAYLKWNVLRKEGEDQYVVNFNSQLFLIIKEAKYLDRLGFEIPPEALNVTLQDEQYHNFVENLKSMLINFNQEIAMVDGPEKAILSKFIAKLKRVLEPGCVDLNWFSLGISEFITRCQGAITEFRNLSREIRKDALHIQSQVVSKIAATQLVADPQRFTSNGELLDLQQVADEIERFRSEALEPCVRAYTSVPALLRKIETLLESTNTGKCERLTSYYEHWEKKIFKALLKMIVNSLTRFTSILGYQHKGTKKNRPPLFKVTVSLSGQEATIYPAQGEIQATFHKIEAGITEATKAFPRWMNGTCIDYTSGEVQPKPTDEAQDFLFTFYDDLKLSPYVLKLQALINRCIQSHAAALHQHIRTFSKFKYVYVSDKHLSVESQAKLQYHWIDYDLKLQQYHNMISEYDAGVHVADFGFMRCDASPFHAQLTQHAQEWIRLEAQQLNGMTKTKLVKLDNRINRFAEDLRQECETIDKLKHVLEVMDDAKTQSLDIELQYRDIEAVYYSMERHRVRDDAGSGAGGSGGGVSGGGGGAGGGGASGGGGGNASGNSDEAELAASLRHKWDAVLADIRVVEEHLGPKKIEFRDLTMKEVAQFLVETKRDVAEYRARGPGREGINLDEGVEQKTQWRERLNKKLEQRQKLVKAEKLFGLDLTLYPSLQSLQDEHGAVEEVYALYEGWMEHLRKWSKLLWGDVRIEDMQNTTVEKLKAAKLLGKTHAKVEPFSAVQAHITNFFNSLDLLTKLKSPALKARHWKDLMKVTNRAFNHENITLDDLVAMEVYKYGAEIDVIVLTASREAAIEKDIQVIKDFWAAKDFTCVKYAPRGGESRCSVLSDTSDIQEGVDDNILKIQSIANVKWVEPFIDEVKIWEKKLSTISDVIAVWVVVQLKWQYLESIFKGSEDIVNQMPKEANKFNELDKRWIRIMVETATTPNVDVACNMPDRCNELKYIEEKLDECQKDLSNYLETKRCLFPRFYFISDDELLSILASSAARAVQDHMLKMFDNCAALIFKGTSDTIEGVESQETEVVTFDTAIGADGHPVERWLNFVLLETRKTLRGILKAAVFYYSKMDRLEWVKKYHGMMALCGQKIWWTFQIEDAFAKVKKGKKGAVKELSAKLSTQLSELVGEMDKDLTKQYRKKVNTLIIVDVHGRDIVDRFVRDSVMDAREFEWESQLRFYWDKGVDTCVISQCTGTFNYGYEYMGLNGRLVITPLTDRCFMTLTQALTFSLGGAPGGPAGTGKTESVKDLAKAMAFHCVVFNCGDGLDYKAMATIFSGLVQAGSWGCFDEFNRIELPVLSVVSEQLRSIQAALRVKAKRFIFSDKEIALDGNVGIFITMNPGYAGRVELPDNLKALFRPVVMSVPDLELIAENMLFSEGFVTARELAKKMVTLYSLARGQLSKQYHYDWGLRALKAVLVMAGQLKRGSADVPEKAVLMRALRDMNAPKFVAEDEPLFKGLIGDLFPGLDPTRVPQENLAKAVAKALKENGYKVDLKQVDKVVQLYETMQTRHTTMVVGPTGGGKSVVINTLRRAQDELRLPTKLFTINPKAQPTSSLYGWLDPMTRNWTDGVFSVIFRNMNKPSDKEGADRERKYIVFDGDVDARWVEDMNSVMDDNKLFTLPNGERIRLHPTCSLLFEVGDLQYASPATVSRVGMVFLDPINLGWQPFTHSWKLRRNKEEVELLNDHFDRYVQPLVNFVLEGIDGDHVVQPPKLVVPTTDLNMVRQLCMMLSTILTPKAGILDTKPLESVFIFCCVWSFGALISSEEDRQRFDSFLKRKSDLETQDNGDDMLRPVTLGKLPERKTLFDYFFDLTDNRWKPWKVLIQPFVRPANRQFSSILVPTVDTERGFWLLDRIVSSRTPVMFVGESGTAKTVTIQAYLRSLKGRAPTEGADDAVHLEEMLLEVNFSSRTTSLDAQRTLEDHIEKRTNVVLGPPAKKRLLVFVDDINMPKVDLYGTQQPIAFLKLLIEFNAWYDRKDLIFKSIRDTQYLAAMAPPGGGRNALDPRFQSLFTVFNIPFPSPESLSTIYQQILDSSYQTLGKEITEITPKLTSMTMELYRFVVESLPATPAKFHYIFNLRDLSRVYEGLCRATMDKFTKEESVVRLWRNEVLRVFVDRMSDDGDKETVQDRVERLIRDRFPAHADFAMADPILFGNFGDYEPDSDKERLHLYEDFGPEYGTVRGLVDLILDDINTPVMKMDLVTFDMALDHLLRICRVLSLNRGHSLLVGVGGSGKQSLTKLAAAICQMQIFEIVLSRGYTEDSFREDLKKLYFKCGVERQKMIFLFTDAHVKQEGFLELINNMLASGMVPALFPEEEKEPLYAAVMQELRDAGLPPSKDNKWSAFVARCRDNLHLVLAMTPSGDVLRTRCRNFPSLINNTTIDWFTKWPRQALSAVATKFLSQEQLPDYLRASIIEHTVNAHMEADDLSKVFLAQLKRNNHVTPKNFLSFLSQYSKLLTAARTDIDDVVGKFKTGLERLQKAAEDVAVMSRELAEKEIDLAARTKTNEAVLAETKALKIQNEQKAKDATTTEEELSVRNVEIERDSAEANQILEEAMPIMEAAAAALSKLDPAKIAELKGFAAPSEKVVAVVKMICVLKNATPSWDAGKIIMGQSGFLDSIKNYPKETLTEKKMKEVRQIEQEYQVTKDNVMSASVAAAEMFGWVKALQEYWEIAKVVAPKKARVEKLTIEKTNMEKRLALIKSEIEYLSANQKELQDRLDQGLSEARKLEAETAIMQRRLDAAQRLLNGFTSERQRWQVEMTELREARTRLVGDCLLGAAFMSYVGAFTHAFRHCILHEKWIPDLQQKNIPVTAPFRIEKLMTNEVDMALWASDGLPTDELSIQNGILTTATAKASKDKKKAAKVRFPLCIDPQMQAVNWIKRMNAKNNRFEVASFSDPDFLKRLEFCIQYGNPYLFENVDEFIDPIIDTILDPVFKEENGQKLVRLGDKEISWDDNFKLYLCTKLANPAYPAEVFGKTLVINYSVTQDGLESQLLNYVVASERSDLQKQSEELVHTMAENKAQLKLLEDSLIRELTLATGNILDNDELIATLESTKSSATDVTNKLKQAEQTSRDIDVSRQEYRPVARRGAILFFVISQLSAINSMYEYSLGAFLQDVFKLSLEKSEPNFDIKERLANIIDYLTYCVYRYVCMGIFEKHKLTLAFQMAVRLLGGSGRMNQEELDFFLRGCLLAAKDFPTNPTNYLVERQWNDICKLSRLSPTFANLADDIRANPEAWREWYVLDRPDDPKQTMPCGYSDTLNTFQKLCVLRCFRTDRVYVAASQFIAACEFMGDKYTVPPILRYIDVYKQSSCLSPIVCVVSPGANPTDEIVKLADKLEMGGNKLKAISLGQGQGEEAMRLVEVGSVRGHWVLLQNCHLLITWMKELEKVVEKRETAKPHVDFRLWLTTEPSTDFPLGILQRSLKVVNEPPNGLKMNMKNTFSKVSEESLETCTHPAFRPLVFTLAFFHAVVQERRKYGKIGWNVLYDFNETDFAISMRLLDTYLEKAVANNDPIPWSTVRYLVGEAMYGGRVTDSLDRRIVAAYLDEYMGDFLFDTFQPFHFFKDKHVDYCLPPGSTDLTRRISRDVMTQQIEEMPLDNAPDVFGLHPNAETNYMRAAAETLWANLIELMPRSGGAEAGGESRESLLTKLATDILSQIPAPFDRKVMMRSEREKAKAQKHDNLQPVQVVLLQEVERWNNLVNAMVLSIKNLQKALAGVIGMSAELDDLASSLSNGQLPAPWRRLAPATRKNLGRWLEHFQRRYKQFKQWSEEGEPVCMWLSGLLVPESYLSALVQTTCRKYVWPLDRSTIFTMVTQFQSADEVTEAPKDGAYVHGLYLEGARWDKEHMCLAPQEKKVLITELPVLKIFPMETSKVKKVGTFRTPVYVTRDRRSAGGVGLVFEADLASTEHASHWILESVALCLNSDD